MAKKEEISEALPPPVKWAIGGVIAFVVFLLLLGCFFVVPAGNRAVVFNSLSGTRQAVYGEGIHGKLPLLETAYKFETRILKDEANAAAASKDLQTVTSTIALNFRLDPGKIMEIYTTEGRDMDEIKVRLIDPAIQESVKASTAKYTAEELITKRELVKQDIKDHMTARLAQYYIIVTDFSMTNFDFSTEFNAAIEKKVRAEQDALTAKNKLEQVKFEKEQRITQAQGEAEAIGIQVNAINQQGGANYVQLQMISKWNGQLPIYMGGNSVPLMDISTLTQSAVAQNAQATK
jgi:regulator of protease activity HflC (stomatin/prohibitin superfamily)